ncbi:MAG: SUMF1/EgtB/PvdO family nonheme iron enzyme [Deltaproteobacteria bacterium]|nr:SUMF1/EgtB/PvdO family nonheme iron enzyme [Deltaproteobacteria bacterium]
MAPPGQGTGPGQAAAGAAALLEGGQGSGADAGPGLESGIDAEEIPVDDFEEILVDEETDILDQAEITAEGSEAEVDLGEAPMAPPRQGTGPGQAAPLDGGGSGADAGPGLESGMDAEEIPVDDFEEILVDEEMDILDQAEIIEEELAGSQEEPRAGIGDEEGKPNDSARPLDLSHYIEAGEALAAPPQTLAESHDDYIAQILERFMPKFIKIPAGDYLTGRDKPLANERPARKIFLPGFYISQLPVTNDLFDFFVRETGYETDAEKSGFGTVVEPRLCNRVDPDTGRSVLSIARGASSHRVQGANWRHPKGADSSLENKANHPVVQVSRRDALAFAAWAGKRLPSEDEWEAAARGSEGFLFPWGNEWHAELANTESSLAGDTTPVTRHGRQSISPFGVYDQLGNVFEWSASLHTPARALSGVSRPIYVLKGGCWTSKAGITTAARLLETDTWSNTIGFRCAV